MTRPRRFLGGRTTLLDRLLELLRWCLVALSGALYVVLGLLLLLVFGGFLYAFLMSL